MMRLTSIFLLAISPVWAQTGQPEFSVSAVVPLEMGQRRIYVGTARRHFHVVLSNRSSVPQRVWSYDDLNGRLAVSFELKDSRGVVRTVRRKDWAFAPHELKYWVVPAAEQVVFDIALGDRTEWEGVPATNPEECAVYSMRAVFEIAATEATRKQGIWAGRAESSPLAVGLCQ